MTTTIEMVSYQLKDNATEAALAVQHEPINEFLLAQEGFIYRSLCQEENNKMLDIIYWRDMASAKKAGEAFMASNLCQQLAEITDMETVVVKHMEAITEATTCTEAA